MARNLLARGLEQHQAGRLSDEKLFYDQILEIDLRHSDARHLPGVVALQRESPDRALGLIEKAIPVNPGKPGHHANLAQARLATERVAQALIALRVAAKHANDNPPAVGVRLRAPMLQRHRTRE